MSMLQVKVPSIRSMTAIRVVIIISRMTTWTCRGTAPWTTETTMPENVATTAMVSFTITVGPSREAIVRVS